MPHLFSCGFRPLFVGDEYSHAFFPVSRFLGIREMFEIFLFDPHGVLRGPMGVEW